MPPKQEKNDEPGNKPAPKRKEPDNDTKDSSSPSPQAKRLRLVLPTKSDTTTFNIPLSSKPALSRETKRSRDQESEEQPLQKKIKILKEESTEKSTKETERKSTTNNLSLVTKSVSTENQDSKQSESNEETKEQKSNVKSKSTFKASKEVEEVLSLVTKSLSTENQDSKQSEFNEETKEQKSNVKSKSTFKASKEVEEVLKTLIADIKKALDSSESPTANQEINGALFYITTSGEVIIRPTTLPPTTDQELHNLFFAAETATQDLLGKEASMKALKKQAIMMTMTEEEEASRQPETSREGARREQRERRPSIKGKEIEYDYMDPNEMTKEQKDQFLMLEHYKYQKDLKDKQQRVERESETVSNAIQEEQQETVSEATQEEQQTMEIAQATTEINPTSNTLQDTSESTHEEEQASETVRKVPDNSSLNEQQILDSMQELLDTTLKDQTTTEASEESQEDQSSTESSDESLEEYQILADIQKVLESPLKEQQEVETTSGDVPENQASMETSSSPQITMETSSSPQITMETIPESHIEVAPTAVIAPDQPRRYRSDQPEGYPLYSAATWDDLPPFKNILRGKTVNGKFMVTEMVCFADLGRPATFASTSNSVLNRRDDQNSPAFERQPIRTPPQQSGSPVPIRPRGLRRSSAYRGRGSSDRDSRFAVRDQGRNSNHQGRVSETGVGSTGGGVRGTESGGRGAEADDRSIETSSKGTEAITGTDNRGRDSTGRGQPSTRTSGSNILSIDDILKGMTRR